MPKSTPRRVSKWLTTAAVAAAVVLGAFVALTVTNGRPTPEVVERSAVGILSDDGFKLGLVSAEHPPIKEWLVSHELPAPGTFPAGLASSRPLGCKELEIKGKPASLICFRTVKGTVHLIVFKRADVKGDLPTLAGVDCHGCERSGWSQASWADADHALFLLGNMDAEALSKVSF